MTAGDIQPCHRTGNSEGDSKKTIFLFINMKHWKRTLVNRKKLRSFNSESIGLPNVKLYFNENLTECNNTMAFSSRKLKRAPLINSTYTLNGTAHILQIVGESPIKVFIWVSYWHCILILNFPAMMVMFQLMLLVIPQFSESIEVL